MSTRSGGRTRTDGRTRTIGLLAGLGIGGIWVVLAALALWSAWQGARDGRSDWALGWGLVGGLLMAAGLAAIIGTWWHLFRVAPPD